MSGIDATCGSFSPSVCSGYCRKPISVVVSSPLHRHGPFPDTKGDHFDSEGFANENRRGCQRPLPGDGCTPEAERGARQTTLWRPARRRRPSADDGNPRHDFTSMTSVQMKGVAKGLFRQRQDRSDPTFPVRECRALPLGKARPERRVHGPFTVKNAKASAICRMNYMDIIKDAIAGLGQQGKAADVTSGYQSWKELLGVLQDNQGAVSGIDVGV